MGNKRILFISWQGGMGHITRDVAIAQEIRRQLPDVELVWLAHPLATRVLEENGEQLLPESAMSGDYNTAFDNSVSGFGLSLMRYVRYGKPLWDQNVEVFKQVSRRYDFDLVIGDEIYELQFAIADGNLVLEKPVVMIHDFLSAVSMSWNPLEKLIWYSIHRKVVKTLAHPLMTHVFIGEIEDIPERKAGLFAPTWRKLASKHMHFLGYVIRFDPREYCSRATLRKKLGYGSGHLIVCALGGASVGRQLLELCGETYPILKQQIRDLEMVAIGGGRFSPDSISLPAEIAIKGYVRDLHEHFAASDLSIVVGGGTSTTELMALQRPFIYFPLEKQFDQQIYIPNRLDRHQAGVKMSFCQTSPEQLAAVVLECVNKEVNYADAPFDGAKKAAKLVRELLIG